jgi:hypothetical protein
MNPTWNYRLYCGKPQEQLSSSSVSFLMPHFSAALYRTRWPGMNFPLWRVQKMPIAASPAFANQQRMKREVTLEYEKT